MRATSSLGLLAIGEALEELAVGSEDVPTERQGTFE